MRPILALLLCASLLAGCASSTADLSDAASSSVGAVPATCDAAKNAASWNVVRLVGGYDGHVEDEDDEMGYRSSTSARLAFDLHGAIRGPPAQKAGVWVFEGMLLADVDARFVDSTTYPEEPADEEDRAAEQIDDDAEENAGGVSGPETETRTVTADVADAPTLVSLHFQPGPRSCQLSVTLDMRANVTSTSEHGDVSRVPGVLMTATLPTIVLEHGLAVEGLDLKIPLKGSSSGADHQGQFTPGFWPPGAPIEAHASLSLAPGG